MDMEQLALDAVTEHLESLPKQKATRLFNKICHKYEVEDLEYLDEEQLLSVLYDIDPSSYKKIIRANEEECQKVNWEESKIVFENFVKNNPTKYMILKTFDNYYLLAKNKELCVTTTNENNIFSIYNNTENMEIVFVTLILIGEDKSSSNLNDLKNIRCGTIKLSKPNLVHSILDGI